MNKSRIIRRFALTLAILILTQLSVADTKDAVMKMERAESLFEVYKLDSARLEYRMAKDLFLSKGDSVKASVCDLGLAKITDFEGYYNKCLGQLEKCEPVFKKAGEYRYLYQVYEVRGGIYIKRGMYDEAVGEFGKAVEAAEMAAAKKLKFEAIRSLGKISLMRGRTEGAMNNFGRALAAAPSRADSGLIYMDIAEIYSSAKTPETSMSYLKMAEEYGKEDPNILADIYGAEARFYTDRKDYFTALKYFAKQLELIKAQQDIYSRAKIMMNMAMIYEIQKQYAKASDFMEEVVKIFDKLNSPEAMRASEYLKKLKGM